MLGDGSPNDLGFVLHQSRHVRELLTALRTAGPRDAYVAAGAVRDCYWAFRHGFCEYEPRDVDVVFFDPATPVNEDAQISRALRAVLPRVQWDVTNQAHVHTWYTHYTGVEIAPLSSTDAGIAMWPETATCVAARAVDDDTVEILAPLGIDDLVDMRWRANPRCPDPSAFVRRLREKRVDVKWPLLRVDELPAQPSGMIANWRLAGL